MKQKLLKTMRVLLVAALLGVGTSASWADDVAAYDFENGTHPFIGRARQTISVVDNAENGTKVFSFVSASNAYNGYALADYDFSSSVSDASTVSFEFDCLLPTADVNHWINIGDAEVRAQTADHGGFATRSLGYRGIMIRIGTGRLSVNGNNETVLAVNNNAIASSATTIKANQVLGKWLHVKVDVDIASKTVDYVIKLKSDNTLVGEGSDIAYYNSAAFCCSQIDVSTINNSSTLLMDNLTITKTVNAAKHYYHINAVSDGKTIQNFSRGFIDKSTEYKYIGLPHYILYGGQYYELDDANVVSYHTTPTYTMGDNNETKEITYTLRSNVKYFKEAESLSGWYNQDQKTSLASGGMSRFLAENKSITLGMSISAGYYNVCASVFKRNNGNGNMSTETVYVKKDASETEIGKFDGWGYPETPALKVISNVYIAEGSDFKISHGNGNSTMCFDYFYLTSADATLVAAIEDCKANETSDAFTTYINAKFAAGELTTAAEVYAAHTAWQIAQAKSSGSTDLTKVIRNAAIADATDWDGATILSGEKYTGAPDDNYLDKNTGSIDASQTIYGLPAGKYVLKAATRSKAGTTGNIYVYSKDQADTKTAINADGNTGGTLDLGWSWTEVEFTLTATSDVKIGFWANTTNYWASCDDFHLTLVGEFVTIPNSSYSSLASAYALDFAKATTTTDNAGELTAYVVTEITKTNVTLSSIPHIPAATGVILKGTPGATYTIPVYPTDYTPTTNLLQAAVTATDIEANAAYILQGGEFHKVTAASTVPAGKAYLLASDVPAEARSLSFVFDSEATGINDATLKNNEESIKDGEFYNLQGQRVECPTKGLYIVNGTKVIIK